MSGNGFPPEFVAACLLRDGRMCAMRGAPEAPHCEQWATTANHRLNRAMGGSKLRNAMSNACAICNSCNDEIETSVLAAREARRRGVKLREGDDPERVALWSPFYRQWVELRADGMFLTGLDDLRNPPKAIH